MAKRVHQDLESRSIVDLKKSGLYVYAESPSTQIICWSYAIDDEPTKVWYPFFGQKLPADLRDAILDPESTFVAHNASFERVMMTLVGVRFLDADVHAELRKISRWRCTAAKARTCALPGALDNVAKALRLPIMKDAEGAKLMLKMCKPRKFTVDGQPVWIEDEASVLRLGEYCCIDTDVERIIDHRLPELPEREQRLWELNETMNDRGVAVDHKFLMRLMMLTEDAVLDANTMLEVATGGRVTKVTQVAQLTDWLKDQGFPEFDDSGIGKAILQEFVSDEDIDEAVREVLTIRLENGKSSTAKFKATAARMNKDRRIRGNLIFCGAAASGRWCLAEGTPVLCKTSDGDILEKPIQCVDLDDLVWDGDSWVEHEGVVFQGDKEVISYEDIVATSDHEVFVSDTDKVALQMARDLGMKLYTGAKDPYDV